MKQKDIYRKLADQILDALAEKGLKPADLARELNVSTAYISQFLKHANKTPVERIQQMADFLGYELSLSEKKNYDEFRIDHEELEAFREMVYEFDHEQIDTFMVAESSPQRRHWAVIREKLAKILHFADEITDEVARSVADDEAAWKSETAAAKPHANQAEKTTKQPICGQE